MTWDTPTTRPDVTLTQCLARVHGRQVMLKSTDGQTLPVLARAIPLLDADTMLGGCTVDERAFPKTSPQLEALQASGAQLWNGPTYVFRGFEQGGRRIACSTGLYFDAVTTCFELRAELHRAVAAWPDDPDTAWAHMRRRRALLEGRTGEAANDWLWKGDGRSATLAISCLLLVNDGERFRYCAARRSTQVSDEPGLHHVVPSMVFQPDPSAAGAGYSITHTVLRELGEELFSLPADGDWAGAAPVRGLRSLMARGDAGHRVTGLVMNLEDLRLEILTLLYVLDPNWLNAFGTAIDLCHREYADGQEPLRGVEELLAGELPEAFRCGRGTVAGTACLALGAPWVRRIAAAGRSAIPV